MIDENSTLCNERPFPLYPTLALAVGGADEALVLQQIKYWVTINKRTNKNFHEGKYWVYNTYKQWQKIFFHIAPRTLERIFLRLEKLNVLTSSRFNKDVRNRTKWYTVNEIEVKKLINKCESRVRQIICDEPIDLEAEIFDTTSSDSATTQSGVLNDLPTTQSGVYPTTQSGVYPTTQSGVYPTTQSGVLYIQNTTLQNTTHQSNTEQITTDKKIKKEKPLSASADHSFSLTRKIFEHWKRATGHTRAKLDGDRSKAIQKALKMGYTEEDIYQAIEGCKRTPFNMGDNPEGKIYDALTLILRSADHIDRFIRHSDRPPCPRNDLERQTDRNIAIAQKWLHDSNLEDSEGDEE